ncbi:MAG: PorP/SprF family type IX secretion system membrane protein [Opitutaceae bacterium]|nr:PorP/SprF family type IX secretion system membrane protein [Cytophagales bacterium]
MKKLILFIFILFSQIFVFGQQPLYTLYYTNPLPVNPAFAGSSHKFRAGINYRNQWSNFNEPITAYSVYADNYFGSINSGIGFLVYTDQAGVSNYRSTRISAYYSYTVKLGHNTFLKAGAEPLVGIQGLNQNNLLFNDQLSVNGQTGTASAESLQGLQKTYFNLNSGLLFTANNFWLGASGYNLLMPQTGFSSLSKLPIGFGAQTGIKIEFMANQISRKEKKERFIMPNVAFSSIGFSKQIYLGTELAYEPFSLGIMLRGNYFSKVSGATNTSSVAISLGFRKRNVQANYTYDIPISNKTGILGPSHEIGIRTLFKIWQKPTRRPTERLDLF